MEIEAGSRLAYFDEVGCDEMSGLLAMSGGGIYFFCKQLYCSRFVFCQHKTKVVLM